MLLLNDEHNGLEKAEIQEHENATKFRTIEEIEIGDRRCKTWYYSPYPEGFHKLECIYTCEFCFSFYAFKEEMLRHVKKCKIFHPPGDEIYRDDRIAVFEVDGWKEPQYCENLCYISKLFLDHKTLHNHTELFLFYVLCEYDETGFHFVGYFSKEKVSACGYNLACILTMPYHQRKGYGKFLIDFSYLLSRKEGKLGAPEKPLSDLGYSTYSSYWTQVLIDKIKMLRDEEEITIKKLCDLTGMVETDVTTTLEDLTILRYSAGNHILVTDDRILDFVLSKMGQRGREIKEELLIWVPYKLKYDI